MKRLKRNLFLLFIFLAFVYQNLNLTLTSAFAVENPLFGYTHLLPSPFTLPAGRVILGSTSGIGVTDFLEVDTDLLSDFFQIYNGRARLSVLDFPGFAAGFYVGYQNVNLANLSSFNPSTTISAWMPGGVIGAEIAPYLALFVGGNLFYPNIDVSRTGIQTSGYLQGAQFESDLSWAYNPHKNRIGNVLSGGVTYNSTFNFYGLGLSHHWKNLHFGIHYYPNASNLKVFPILAGGAAIDL